MPVLVDDSEPPLAFRRIQTAGLVGWSGKKDEQFESVVTAVQTAAEAPRSDSDQTIGRGTKAGWDVAQDSDTARGRRWPLVLATVVAILVVGVAITQTFFGGCDDIECRAQVTRLLNAEETALSFEGYERIIGGQWETDRLNDDEQADKIIGVDSSQTYALIAACNEECRGLGVIVTGENGLELGSSVTDSSVAITGLTTEEHAELKVSILMNDCRSQPCDYGLRLLGRPQSQ